MIPTCSVAYRFNVVAIVSRLTFIQNRVPSCLTMWCYTLHCNIVFQSLGSYEAIRRCGVLLQSLCEPLSRPPDRHSFRVLGYLKSSSDVPRVPFGLWVLYLARPSNLVKEWIRRWYTAYKSWVGSAFLKCTAYAPEAKELWIISNSWRLLINDGRSGLVNRKKAGVSNVEWQHMI